MQDQKELYSKLKVRSLLDLALLIPHSYEDTTLSKALVVGEHIAALARVESIKKLGDKLQANLFLPQFRRFVTATFFKVTPYHYALFGVGSELFIQGKLTQFGGSLQISQPKKIQNPNSIIPKYKTNLKNSEMIDIVKSFLTYENLRNEGLNDREAKNLLLLHFPKNLNDLFIDRSLKKDIIHDLKMIEAFDHFKKLKNKRVDFPATASLSGDIKQFTDSLPFELTSEQKKVINVIRSDLANQAKAAKRVIIGDVGSGKTMVILASAMTAYPHKSILMAPTSLLAQQLYEEAVKFLPKEVNVALVMQGKNIGDYKSADFIIGTHALLYKEDLPAIDLVMIDEQHRFGTNQRNILAKFLSRGGKKVHMLQFSATPIPRTQAMMDSALVDVSLIESTPFSKNISTHIISKEDFPPLLGLIKHEISQNHQVLIVYPLVGQSEQIPYQSIEEASAFWKKNFDNVYITHGKDKDKDEVLFEFREKGDILLATTVVEVGISLPRLTVVVVVGAERLGLATLHQLRGRVGRLGLKSYCYLYTHNKLNDRLIQFAKTSSGFDIAKLDLEFRNSGDIISGTIQSGQKFRWLDMASDEEIVESAKNRALV